MAEPLQLNDAVHVTRDVRQLEGVISFLGSVSFADGDDWVGVRLTGASIGMGKNDGSVQDASYFMCPQNCGMFVRQAAVTKRSLTRLEELRLRRELASSSTGTTAPAPVATTASTVSKLEALRLRRAALAEKKEGAAAAARTPAPAVDTASESPSRVTSTATSTATTATTVQPPPQPNLQPALDKLQLQVQELTGKLRAKEQDAASLQQMQPMASMSPMMMTTTGAENPISRVRRRQAAVAVVFALLPVLLLAVCSAWLLFDLSPRLVPGDDDHDSNSASSRLAGGVLMSQSISCFMLLLPLLCDCGSRKRVQYDHVQTLSVHLSRAASVCMSLTGLAMVVIGLVFHSQQESSIRVLITGVVVTALTCASLMASFWPSMDTGSSSGNGRDTPEEEIIFSSTADERQAEIGGEENENERNPLLSSLNATGVDESIDQECYHLLEDLLEDEWQDEEAPVQETEENDDEADAQVEGEEEVVAITSRLRGTSRLLQLAAPQVLYLYAGCAVLLIRLPFSLSIPHFVSTTLTAVAVSDWSLARHEIVWLVVLGSIDSILDFWCVFLFGYANQRIVRGVRLDLFSKLVRQDVAFFDSNNSGSLASRLNSDCSEMAGDLTWFFRFSIESVVRITGIATYMLVRSPVLGGSALAIIPVVAVINKVYGNWLRKNAIEVQDALAEANAVAQEALANIRTVIAFAGERHESTRYKSKIDRQYQLNIRQLYMTGVYYMVVSTFLINTIVQASLLWIGTTLIEDDKLTAGVLLAFMLYQGQLQNETLNLFQSYSSLIKSSGAGDKVFALLDRSPPAPSINSPDVQAVEEPSIVGDGVEDPNASIELPRHEYNVQLCDVSFHYPSRPNHAVLQHLNLDIPRGETLALVGSSGCGKSTIVNLLQRLYDPSAGSVMVDGTDLRKLDLLRHRRHIGVVTQDPVLFSGSVLENITYGCPGATREQAVQAAQRANADPFIRQFPDGYETAVGERGVQLSGGQRQRIAISRAISRNPGLLILDEATSALDAESEHLVQEALDQLLQDKNNKNLTTVVVAHRLRTVRNADCIAFLEGGRVVEKGTHDELMQSPMGHYRRMVERAGSTGVLPEH